MPQPFDLSQIDVDRIKGELAKRSLKEFVKAFWPFIEPATAFCDNWHIDAICDHLANLKDIKNLLINCPPRVSKSLLSSVFFPAWAWISNPGEKFLYTSYSYGLAERDSLSCRRLVESPLYQKCYNLALKEDQCTKRKFENTKGGVRQCTSIQGATTGEGGSVIVVDDPHSADESETELANVTKWFTEVFFNRLNNPHTDCRIVIGQRVHNKDLSQFIIDNYSDTWTVLSLPYEYRPTTFVSIIGWKDPRKVEAEPLWPKRFPESEIRQLKKRVRVWQTQYNQSPTAGANCLFNPDNFRFYDECEGGYKLGNKTVDPRACFRIVGADFALTQNTRSDYSVIIVADITREGDVIVKHLIREKFASVRLVPMLCEIDKTYRPSYCLLEDVAFSRLIIDQARQEGLTVRGIHPQADKESRSLPLQVRFEAGQIWFPKNAQWLPAAERELTEFPNSSHDDIVDCLSYVAYEANRRTRHRPERPQVVEKQTEQELYRAAMLEGIE